MQEKKLQDALSLKIDKKVEAAIQEKKLQDSLSMKVRIWGLPSSPWNNEEDSFEETLDKLNQILEPINIKHHSICGIDEDKGHVPLGQCILTFRNKEEWVRLLRQSHLLCFDNPTFLKENRSG